MSFTLTDLSSENFEFTSTVWNWKAALEVIKSLDIVGEGQLRQMTYTATGVKISAEDAHQIGMRIQNEWLPNLAPNKRVLGDLSITDAPDDMIIHSDDDEQWKNYSASYDFMKELAEFCLRSKGFQIF